MTARAGLTVRGTDRRHMPTTIYRRRLRDGFRKTYWVACWHCDLLLGPFPRGFCRFVMIDLDGGFGDPRPECAVPAPERQ